MQLYCIADCSVYVPKDVFCGKSEKKDVIIVTWTCCTFSKHSPAT